ncbi:hypothetical protein NS376_14615 [Pseudomonas oryzihabitans]|nr:hypothetical protein NS376_14615 [Pseudomonas psychrotolerans]
MTATLRRPAFIEGSHDILRHEIFRLLLRRLLALRFGWLWIARYRLGPTAIALLLHPLRDLQDVAQPLVFHDGALADLRQLIQRLVGKENPC